MHDIKLPAVDLAPLETSIGYVFKEKRLLKSACHHKTTRSKQKNKDFERLEFLGDRVLGLAMADILCATYVSEDEGDLAKRFAVLVSKECCLKVAQALNLSSYLTVSKADLTPQSNILSDAVEAILGAIYSDSDFGTVKQCIHQLWHDLLSQDLKPPRDPKTALQEWSQAKFKCTPHYELLAMTGPDHAPTFRIKARIVRHEKTPLEAIGEGITKRQAEHAAAYILLKENNVL